MTGKSALLTIVLMTAALAAGAQNWTPAGSHIMTTWGEKVNPGNVHAEYPRPQLVRGDWKSLNGLWKWSVTGRSSSRPSSFGGDILVPFCIESSLSGVGRPLSAKEALWYETTFTVPSKWKRKRVLLNFEAVDWKADVWVNDKFVGAHTGGYTRFSFDITSFLKSGRKAQKLVVKVIDETDNDLQPHGRQLSGSSDARCHTPVSGIWQDVWIESVPDTYIKDYLIVPDVTDKTVDIVVNVENPRPGDVVTVSLFEDKSVYSSVTVEPGKRTTLSLPSMKLWTPENPKLYDVEFWLERGGHIIEDVSGYAAMREISIVTSHGRSRFAINNEPVYMLGVLDPGLWPDGLYTAPSDEAVKFDIMKAKSLGFNAIRKYAKVEPSRWYYWCDKLGIMVWQDMPPFADRSGGTLGQVYGEGVDFPASDAARSNFYREWGEIISQLRMFPCIVTWVPFNEAMGQFDTGAVVDFTRGKDPTRLVDAASGGNFVQGCGDIVDNHSQEDPVMTFWDPWKVTVLGEFGGAASSVRGHVWDRKSAGYSESLSPEEFLEEYRLMSEKLLTLAQFGCGASFYRQLTDVENDLSGIVTYDRKALKTDEESLAEINGEVLENFDL